MAKLFLLLMLLLLTSCATIPCDLDCYIGYNDARLDQEREDMEDFEEWYQKYLDNQYQIGVKDKLWTYDIQECMTDSECEEAWARAEDLHDEITLGRRK